MKITFKQLRLIMTLSDTGSVSAAAKTLHITQPTASMQLKEITQALGFPLYDVIGKKLVLTAMGEELAVTARNIHSLWNAFEQEVDAAKGLQRGKLKIAIVNTAEYFIPRWVGLFCQKHPNIDVSLEIMNRDGVVQRLRQRQDDLYIMSMPPSDLNLNDDVLLPNPIVVVADLKHPLTQQEQVTLNDLKKQRFILRETGSGTRMTVDRHFSKMKFKPDIRLELGSNEAIKESVAGGLGLGILSQHALHGREKEYGVCVLKVNGFPLPSSWHMVHHTPAKLSPAANAFREHVLNVMDMKKAPR